MPLYDLECTGCANIEEVFYGMHEDPIILCHICDSRMVRVTLVAPAGNVSMRTIGALADRNTERVSRDEKESISPSKKHNVKEIKRRLQ